MPGPVGTPRCGVPARVAAGGTRQPSARNHATYCAIDTHVITFLRRRAKRVNAQRVQTKIPGETAPASVRVGAVRPAPTKPPQSMSRTRRNTPKQSKTNQNTVKQGRVPPGGERVWILPASKIASKSKKSAAPSRFPAFLPSTFLIIFRPCEFCQASSPAAPSISGIISG